MILHCYGKNPHECLPHAVALAAGEYEQRRLDVTLQVGGDGPHAVSLGLIGTTLANHRAGGQWRTMLPYTAAPIFWLRARSPHPLSGPPRPTIARYPHGSPVDILTTRALAAVGLSDETSLSQEFPGGVRGDLERLSALANGAVDLAVVGSGTSRGWADDFSEEVLFFGDVLRVPSAGLAVNTLLLDPHDRDIQLLIASHAAALRRIRVADPVALACCEELVHERRPGDALALIRDVLSPTFDGGGLRWPSMAIAFDVWLENSLPITETSEHSLAPAMRSASQTTARERHINDD